jgi:hemerythrin-like domain-containing protein
VSARTLKLIGVTTTQLYAEQDEARGGTRHAYRLAMALIQTLREEHEIILSRLRELEALAAAATADVDAARGLVAFLVEFADGEHHAKEEGVLFPALRAAGLPSPGPVDVMLREHDLGRGLIARMREALDEGDWSGFSSRALAYVHLLRAHIGKENDVLFRIAERLLPEAHAAR